MESLTNILQTIHVVNALLMAWPFYALVAVNQRGRLGPPLGDRVDVYMENIIKNRTVPCFVFQGTALLSGAALVVLRGRGLGDLVAEPILALKFFPLLLIGCSHTFIDRSSPGSMRSLPRQAVLANPDLASR
jgi:hypothetical protein